MTKLLIIFILMCGCCSAAVVPYGPVDLPIKVQTEEPFRTKSKYKTKARYFRKVEARMLQEIREYFIRRSWRELEDPELRRRTFPDIPELNH